MSDALDRFFAHYYARRPVNATFTGVHTYDTSLPDWSPEGLAALDVEMRAMIAQLADAYPAPVSEQAYATAPELLDAHLARSFLEIQLAENASEHGVRGNPALWTGEAVFAVVSLMIRSFAPLEQRMIAATARLLAIPGFLDDARRTLGPRSIPESWIARALRECDGANILLARGVARWIATDALPATVIAACNAACVSALGAFDAFAQWLRARPPDTDTALGCGAELYDALLAKGHQCIRSRAELLREARASMTAAQEQLNVMLSLTMGSWEESQGRLADDHPARADYLTSFQRIWTECHQSATSIDVVTWPEWPIRYVPYPAFSTDAAPYLYYLHYRSPAPHEKYQLYEYVVPPLPMDPGDCEQHLRAWNHSVIKLNHVVHHGAIGHHVQNWHAYHQQKSRVGAVAAVDCASRIGMFCGGSMAEGWACYATELMEELGFLTPLERIAQQHTRVRLLARAIVDIELHQGTMCFADAVQFYVSEARLTPGAAHAEAVKNSMFPATAIMYWLGTQGILDLRETMKRNRGASFSRKAFHDELLGYGSVPVPLVARLMTGTTL